MKQSIFISLFAFALSIGSSAQAAGGLIIHAAEFGIGKFHRMDNKVHGYGSNNRWGPYVLPDSANTLQKLVQKNGDGTYTIFFTNLEEVLTTAAEIAQHEQRPIAILNLEAHGLPGGMWYPKNAAQRDSGECSRWRQAAMGSDEGNYDQYYSAVEKSEITYYRQYAQKPTHAHQPCVTGLPEWTEELNKVQAFRQALAPNAEIHFVSCLVGLGNTGDTFTLGLTKAVFGDGLGKVMTSINFGLGDWSIPEGMGFWDYINDQQLNHDNDIYPKNKRDRDIAQPGNIRVGATNNGHSATQVFGGIMYVDVNVPLQGRLHTMKLVPQLESRLNLPMPTYLRIPGTRAAIFSGR